MRVYATPAAVEAWSGDPQPDNTDTLIRYASVLVEKACRNDLYDTTPAGLPEDEDVAEAMSDAVCAQVIEWAKAGTDPAGGAAGVPTLVSSTKIGTGQVTYDASTTAAAQAKAATGLGVMAFSILRNAGLATARVRSR